MIDYLRWMNWRDPLDWTPLLIVASIVISLTNIVFVLVWKLVW